LKEEEGKETYICQDDTNFLVDYF